MQGVVTARGASWNAGCLHPAEARIAEPPKVFRPTMVQRLLISAISCHLVKSLRKPFETGQSQDWRALGCAERTARL